MCARSVLSLLSLATFLAVTSASAAAQEAGTVELGGFFQGTRFDEATTLSGADAFGGGGLLGVFLARNLAFEGAAGRTWTEDASPAGVDGTHTPIRARLVFAIPLTGWLYPLIGVGGVHNRYDGLFEQDDWAASGLMGFKAYFSDRLALRSDVTADYAWEPFNDGATVGGSTVDRHLNWTVTAGFSIDVGTGRTRDTDGDGVRDRMDLCADTPPPVRVDSSGCRLDGDRDGVFDEDDRCTATPTGVRVDSSGCRVDTDGDGIFDEDDRCTATPAGTRVDAADCPVLFEPETTVVVLEGVTFETGSATLTTGARDALNRVALSLVGNPDVRVEVSGHTDSTGSRALNVTLSQQRAESVVAYLALRGVALGRMV
ncbi:MAG TPA: OmpA family protein, partial [Longimicrobiales bacterium]|nr:OmpA family protein [Longimicrobiales bacterium]